MSTRHARVADKELNDKHTKILTDLLQKPENKKCADCKKKDPRWASWNLGVFICIRCSGTHRSLGTHISKVKSVDLDTWIPEQIDSMVKWGNQRANVYWESELNGRLPTENNMEMWIRAKYEQRKWAAKGPVPDPTTIQTHSKSSSTTSTVSQKPENGNSYKPKSSNREFGHHYHTAASTKEGTERPSSIKLNHSNESITKTAIATQKKAASSALPLPPATDTNAKINMALFQTQLSGLSLGRSSTGLIPKAPPGSNMSWTNFLTAHKPTDTNTTLAQTSTEEPLIPSAAFANLLKQ
ncbi:Zn finger-containing GTPase- Activating Protein for ARF [Mucor velutinosus]|uniref:Zn finger-containing GTPase- Activating Protein for ARF n=1 Tax=Mucor velutinosus TaxID=708070 RepID=A0AAN7DDC3_9FUNG|nr:Zn finger-containing GTPase- Activating Protein for ARF [Mucor velutinosus]